MAANRHHGVTAQEFTSGVRPIDDISTAVIGMVCTADDADSTVFPENKPVFFSSAYSVLDKAGIQGTLAKSLDAIVDQTDAQVVIVRVPHSDTPTTLNANVVAGIRQLRHAKSVTGFAPKILGLPELDTQANVSELMGVAQATRAFVYAKALDAENITEVNAYRANFGQRELMLIDNEFINGEHTQATIARVLGARAKLDTQIGWHKSISNTEINGVTQLKHARNFDLLDKNCEANVLNNNEITTLIREKGFRIWGNRTCSAEPMYAFEVATRSSQIVQETIANAFLWAMDKPMHPSLLSDVIMSINAKLAEFVNKGQLLGARVFLNEKLVTKETLAAGKFPIDYEITTVPPLENMLLNQHITDTFFVNLAEKMITFASSLKPTTV